MLLGGAMFRFSKINSIFGGSNHNAPPIASVMVSRWAYEAIVIEEFKNNKFEKNILALDRIESNLNYKLSYVFPKIEELIEQRVERDTLLTEKEKDFLDKFTKKNIDSEFKLAEKKYGKIELKDDQDSLSAVKEIIIEKYNFIINKKDSLINDLKKDNITREQYTNANIDETVTNSIEKEKIEIDSANLCFVEIIDPIFQDADEKALAGLTSHMFSMNKKIGSSFIPTYTYNLIIMWLINVIGFLILYFDLLKKLFSISLKKQS